jgi:hypothetical protein
VDRKYTIFVRQLDGQPQVITVAEAGPDERKSLPYLVLARMRVEAREDGLPADGELSRTGKIEDRVAPALKDINALHLGHICGAGYITAALAAKSSAPEFITVKTGLLKKETVALESRHDPEWSWFAQEMEPTPVEYEMSQNIGLHQTLSEYGNDPSKERPVDFACFLPTEAARDRFVEESSQKGFRLGEEGVWSNDQKHFVQVTCDMNTEQEAIGEKCADLRASAKNLGGDLDGWACPVVQ